MSSQKYQTEDKLISRRSNLNPVKEIKTMRNMKKYFFLTVVAAIMTFGFSAMVFANAYNGTGVAYAKDLLYEEVITHTATDSNITYMMRLYGQDITPEFTKNAGKNSAIIEAHTDFVLSKVVEAVDSQFVKGKYTYRVVITAEPKRNKPVYLFDHNIIVKVTDNSVISAMETAGWKKIAATPKVDAEVSNYGPNDDPGVVKEEGVIIYPTSDNPIVRQDRKYCAKWFAHSNADYQQKVVKRLKDLSVFLK